MRNKFNKITSIRKGFISPGLIFSATYVLFAAKNCFSFYNSDSAQAPIELRRSVLPIEACAKYGANNNNITPLTKSEDNLLQENPVSSLDRSQIDKLGVKSLLGQATILNLDGYLCGLFIASETEDVFLLRLPAKDQNGWMSLCQQDPALRKLYIRYDMALDPRIIKIDPSLLPLLSKYCSRFFDNYRKHYSNNVEFFYQAPLEDNHIFTEDGITPSTQFKKNIYKKFSISTTGEKSLATSRLSIQGRIASDTLKHIDKVSFLLSGKGNTTLVSLVKNILESDPEWSVKPMVSEKQDYINCPASLLFGNNLKSDVRDLDLTSKNDDTTILLESYGVGYCYLNHGSYYRLIPLNNLNASIKKEEKSSYFPCYYVSNPIIPPSEEVILENTDLLEPGLELKKEDFPIDSDELVMSSSLADDQLSELLSSSFDNISVIDFHDMEDDFPDTEAVSFPIANPCNQVRTNQTSDLKLPASRRAVGFDSINQKTELPLPALADPSESCQPVPPPPPPPMPSFASQSCQPVPPPPPPPMPLFCSRGSSFGDSTPLRKEAIKNIREHSDPSQATGLGAESFIEELRRKSSPELSEGRKKAIEEMEKNKTLSPNQKLFEEIRKKSLSPELSEARTRAIEEMEKNKTLSPNQKLFEEIRKKSLSPELSEARTRAIEEMEKNKKPRDKEPHANPSPKEALLKEIRERSPSPEVSETRKKAIEEMERNLKKDKSKEDNRDVSTDLSISSILRRRVAFAMDSDSDSGDEGNQSDTDTIFHDQTWNE